MVFMRLYRCTSSSLVGMRCCPFPIPARNREQKNPEWEWPYFESLKLWKTFLQNSWTPCTEKWLPTVPPFIWRLLFQNATEQYIQYCNHFLLSKLFALESIIHSENCASQVDIMRATYVFFSAIRTINSIPILKTGKPLLRGLLTVQTGGPI